MIPMRGVFKKMDRKLAEALVQGARSGGKSRPTIAEMFDEPELVEVINRIQDEENKTERKLSKREEKKFEEEWNGK